MAVDIYSLPATFAPDGEVQDLINPPSLFWPATILGYSFLIITLCFFSVRMYTNGFLLKKLQWDDYTCIIAVILFIPFDSLLIYSVYRGGGRHLWDMTIGSAIDVAHIASVVENLYCMAHLFAKISLLQQIRRIFSGTKKKGLVFVSCTVCLWGNVLFYVATMAAHIGGCQPAEFEWNKLLTGHCINIQMLVVVSSAINVFTDLTIFVIPIYAVWRLVMPTRRKIAIGIIFATGALSFLFSILRLYFTVPLLTSDDLLWQLLLSGLWTIPEISTAIICGCMPSIPLFVRSFRAPQNPDQPTSGTSYGPGSLGKRKAPPNSRRLHISNWSKYSTQREKIPVEAPPVPKMDPEMGLTSTISAVPRALVRHSSGDTGSTFVELDQGGSPRPSTSGTMSKIMNPAITVTTTISQPMSPSQLALITNEGGGARISQRTMDTPITLHPDDGTLPPTSPSIESELASRDPFATTTEPDRAMSVSPDRGTSISSPVRSLASTDLISPLVSRSSSTRMDANRRRRAEQRAARLARGHAVEMEDTSLASTRAGASSELNLSQEKSGLGISNSQLERSNSAPPRPKLEPARSKYAPKSAKYQPEPLQEQAARIEPRESAQEPPRAGSAPVDHATAVLDETDGKARAEDDAATQSSSDAPPTPLSKRPPSLSERTSSVAGRQAMASLRGRFWRDSIDENRDAEERALATWRTAQRSERNARERHYERTEAEREARAVRMMLH